MQNDHSKQLTDCQYGRTPVATLTVALHITVILQRGGRIGVREIMRALENEYGICIGHRRTQRMVKALTEMLPIITDGGNPAGYWWHGGHYAQQLKRAAIVLDDAAVLMRAAA